METECQNCGAKYVLTASKNPYGHRDKDCLNCEYCGHEISSWNTTATYSAK